ncbi:hypothetical protein [Halorussus caseinilyticus]|uniref:hypothetical protein n=1 Tax=Halorussus caseinilyticus TaxID=3034025 RepID=UPI0023E8B3B3|nr:hypothetical protein [Halorussus sp. DT72]
MTGIAELLTSAGASAPVQRVRNDYLTHRRGSPRARDSHFRQTRRSCRVPKGEASVCELAERAVPNAERSESHESV